jgi:hypothetical protein
MGAMSEKRLSGWLIFSLLNLIPNHDSNVLWHVDPLLSNDRETKNKTKADIRQ